jgi:hypothetical protein
MQSSDPVFNRSNSKLKCRAGGTIPVLAAFWVGCFACSGQQMGATTNAAGDSISGPTDPVLNLLLQKGMITEEEASKTQAQADALRTNMAAQYLAENTKWKISKDIKDLELFGDLRLRFEDREETDPTVGTPNEKKKPGVREGKIDLQRWRYSLRFGMRGDVFDDFYFGFRLETSSNPRSTWVTMGGDTPDPYGKSTLGINVGQLYLGWAPASWFDLTVGRMPNPLFTSSMVWSSSINPEGLAEHLKYTVGQVDFFANLAQFLYQDENPAFASPNLGVNSVFGQTGDNIYQLAWQGGFDYHIATNIDAKVGATIYEYYNLKRSNAASGGFSPYFGDDYVGEGAYEGPGSGNPINGYSGYGTPGNLPGYLSVNYPNNQVGLDHLLVLEVPFEFNVKVKGINLKAFGDFAYNLDGRARAMAAASGYAAYLKNPLSPGTIKPFKAQVNDVKAYQFGLAVGSKDALGMVNGSTVKKNAWEMRGYWQHVEQYSLDPNLLDLDYFAGAENLQGFFAAFSYGFSDNFIGTIRYGHANRINNKLGTGGTGTDIPNINPIKSLDIFQADLTFKF